jgi:hypothetical protein
MPASVSLSRQLLTFMATETWNAILEGVQLAYVNRTELMAMICDEQWKPDIDKLKKHKLSDQRDGVWNHIDNKKKQAP